MNTWERTAAKLVRNDIISLWQSDYESDRLKNDAAKSATD